MVEFISYDGAYPSLCIGTLILKIDGKICVFPESCLLSGGCVNVDRSDKNAACDFGHYIKGRWRAELPASFEKYRGEIEDCVNRNIPYGCCGGCL